MPIPDSDHDKIIRVEEKLNALTAILLELKDNHLAHIKTSIDALETKVDSINTKLAYWSGAIVVVIWILERFIK